MGFLSFGFARSSISSQSSSATTRTKSAKGKEVAERRFLNKVAASRNLPSDSGENSDSRSRLSLVTSSRASTIVSSWRKTPSCLGPDSFLAITNSRSMSFAPIRHLAPVSNLISSLPASTRWMTFKAETRSTISGSSSNPPRPTTSTSIPFDCNASTISAIADLLRINTAQLAPSASAGLNQSAICWASCSMVSIKRTCTSPLGASGMASSFTGSTRCSKGLGISKLA
ncbi:unannotated protein [freshwater metagenome]|uniref:Unannotated protein n=1 Tax=freshwater metagenome TaxID=449393 RepID=A0A6J6CPK4_9ZZZZ